MKILILGASGMLGKDVAALFSEIPQYEIHAIYRNKSNKLPYNINVRNLDITNEVLFSKALKEINPDIIIHSAAVVNVDACEDEDKEYAMLLHAYIIKTIAAVVPDTKLIYISTDSVFDGENGNYTEMHTPRPLNVYAASKYKGELNTMNLIKNHIVVRTNIFGYHLFNQVSLSEWAFNNLKENKSIIGFGDVFFNPLYTRQLASILLNLIEVGYKGVINVGSNTCINKYSFLVELARIFGYDANLVENKPVKTANFRARRPGNTSLDTRLLEKTIGYVPDLYLGLDMFHTDYIKTFVKTAVSK